MRYIKTREPYIVAKKWRDRKGKKKKQINEGKAQQ